MQSRVCLDISGDIGRGNWALLCTLLCEGAWSLVLSMHWFYLTAHWKSLYTIHYRLDMILKVCLMHFELQMPSDVFLVAFWAPSFSSFWSTCSLTKWRPQDKDFLSNRSLLNVQVITNLPQGHNANPGENERRTTWATTLAPNFLTSSGHAEVPLSFGCQCCHPLRLANIRDVLERKFGQSFRNCSTLDFEAMDCMNEM